MSCRLLLSFIYFCHFYLIIVSYCYCYFYCFICIRPKAQIKAHQAFSPSPKTGLKNASAGWISPTQQGPVANSLAYGQSRTRPSLHGPAIVSSFSPCKATSTSTDCLQVAHLPASSLAAPYTCRTQATRGPAASYLTSSSKLSCLHGSSPLRLFSLHQAYVTYGNLKCRTVRP